MDKRLIFLVTFFVTIQAEQNWYNFKTHWTTFVYDGFWDQPRTVDAAIAAGWEQISSDCSDGARLKI